MIKLARPIKSIFIAMSIALSLSVSLAIGSATISLAADDLLTCVEYQKLIGTDPDAISKICEREEWIGKLQSGINIFLLVIGILATFMIIFGGFRYLTSAGDEKKVVAAKNTILYAVIGLVIALSAGALVNFVIF